MKLFEKIISIGITLIMSGIIITWTSFDYVFTGWIMLIFSLIIVFTNLIPKKGEIEQKILITQGMFTILIAVTLFSKKLISLRHFLCMFQQFGGIKYVAGIEWLFGLVIIFIGIIVTLIGVIKGYKDGIKN